MAVEEYVNKLGQKRYQPVLEDGLRLVRKPSGSTIWSYTMPSYYEPVLYFKFWAEFVAWSQEQREKRDDWKKQRSSWAKNE